MLNRDKKFTDYQEPEKKNDRIDRGQEGITKSFGGPAGPPTAPEPPLGDNPALPAEPEAED